MKGYKPDGESKPGVTRWYGFDCFKIVPHMFTDDDSGVCDDVVESLGAGTTLFSLPSGGGMIFNRDGFLEPIQHMLEEVHYDFGRQETRHALLLPPPKGTGTVVAMQKLAEATTLTSEEKDALKEDAKKAAIEASAIHEEYPNPKPNPDSNWRPVISMKRILPRNGIQRPLRLLSSLVPLSLSLGTTSRPWKNIQNLGT